MRWHKCGHGDAPKGDAPKTRLMCPTCGGGKDGEIGCLISDLMRPSLMRPVVDEREEVGEMLKLNGIKRELRHLSSKRLTQITLARILQLLAAEDKDILMVEELRRRVDGESNCRKED